MIKERFNLMYIPAIMALSIFVWSTATSKDNENHFPPLEKLTRLCQKHGGLISYTETETVAKATCKNGKEFTIIINKENK